MTHARIIGLGACLPANCTTNHDLASRMDTSDDWITERTGIRQRHIAASGEVTSDLAAAAAREAIANAGIAPESIEMILLATATPDATMPATAVITQNKLGIHGCPAMDINAACSGFVYALTLAEALIASHQYKRILVIGAETFSRIVDWEDRGTSILFGDGAGAAVLQADDSGAGILASRLYADGAFESILYTDGGVSRTQTAGKVRMAGREVFKHAVQKMSDAMLAVLADAGRTTQEVDWLVPHQANSRILEAVRQRLDISAEKSLMTLDKHANTSAASIPLALYAGVTSGRIQKNQLVALPALGAGLTWGACVIHW